MKSKNVVYLPINNDPVRCKFCGAQATWETAVIHGCTRPNGIHFWKGAK